MKIYLAAPWSEKVLARVLGMILAQQGHLLTEEWWEHPETTDGVELERQARLDMAAIERADLLILLNLQPRGGETSGKAVEFGYALALGKSLIVVGARSNLFHHLPEVHVVPTISKLFADPFIRLA